MADPTILGRFVWHELLTSDTKSAAAFFGKVTGWKPAPWSQDPSYITFMSGKRAAAGLMALPEEARAMGAPPSWLTYVGTPRLDDTVRSALSLGREGREGGVGYSNGRPTCRVADPQDAVFALFTPAENQSGAAPDPGAFSWHELATSDWRSALSFYQRLFGWEPTSAMDMGPELGTYQMFGHNGTPVGGIYNRPSHVPHSNWLPYIRVADSKKTADLVRKLRGQIVSGPMEVPGGDWIFVGSDLQGAAFAVHSPRPAGVRKAAAGKPAAKKASRKVARKPQRRWRSRNARSGARRRARKRLRRTPRRRSRREGNRVAGARRNAAARGRRVARAPNPPLESVANRIQNGWRLCPYRRGSDGEEAQGAGVRTVRSNWIGLGPPAHLSDVRGDALL